MDKFAEKVHRTGTTLDESKTVKDLGIYVAEDVTWKKHFDERLKQANKKHYMAKRNVAVNVKTSIKLGLYKLLILPILLYGFSCVSASRAELQSLERFQKICCQMNNRYQGIVLWKSVTPSEHSASSNVHSDEWYFVPRIGYDRDDEINNIPDRQDPQRRIKEVFTRPGLKMQEVNLASELACLLFESRNTSISVTMETMEIC